MPASILTKETLAEGFGEGSEDAKEKGRYIDLIREDMEPSYAFVDRLVMQLAWTEDFYESFRAIYTEYADKPYETAMHEWITAFAARWPNYLTEPESEKSKTADVQFKAVVAMIETLLPALDPQNKAALVMWAADNANEREELFAAKLDFDPESLESHFEEQRSQQDQLAAAGQSESEEGIKAPKPFAASS
jgi:hypothetical protein